MKRTKRKSIWPVILTVLLVLLLIPLGAMGYFYVRDQIAISKIPELQLSDISFLEGSDVTPQPETELGQALYQARRNAWQWGTVGEAVYTGGPKDRSVEQTVYVTTLDVEQLTAGLDAEVQEALSQQALEALRSDQVYGEDGAYRPELSRRAFERALEARLPQAHEHVRRQEAAVTFDWYPELERWLPREDEAFHTLQDLRTEMNRDPDALADALYETAAAELEPVYKTYEPLDEYAVSGPVPTAAFFGETTDPAEVAELLRSVTAQRLIDGQDLVWNPDIALYSDTIRYYMDDTLLVIVWQEVEAEAVGTFAEVFVADGSQLRRKISGDQVFDLNFETTTDFCVDANAVLAVGGDFYSHDRNCGISVYQRQICRFDPVTCDTCYITGDGDMLFSYRHQFETQAEAEQFLAENDVLFSVAFGPVLIDNGVDVTPDHYPWGEINDTYACSAIGMLGRHHYLTMNINCSTPGRPTYNLATLRQAADAMVERGCIKAYTLDGGQTATTAFHGELINPVQFGAQKAISDVIYFATAVPNP